MSNTTPPHSSDGSVHPRFPINRAPTSAPREVFDMEVGEVDNGSNQRFSRRKFRKYSKSAISIFFLVASLIVSVIAAQIGFAMYMGWLFPQKSENITESLHPFASLAELYAQNLDFAADPCDNMYHFACGQTLKQYKTKGLTYYDGSTDMLTVTKEKLEHLLSSPQNSHDSNSLSSVRVLFQKCIDERAAGESIDGLTKWIIAAGGWPLMGCESLQPTETWIDVVYQLNKAGIETVFPFRFSITANPHSYSRMALELQPFLHDRSELLPIQAQTTKFLNIIMATLNRTNLNLEKDWKLCVKLESDIFKLLRRESNKTAFTVTQLKSNYSEFPWSTFFRTVTVNTDSQIQNDDIIWIEDPTSIPALVKLIHKTSPITIRNYLMFRVLHESMNLMPDKIRQSKPKLDETSRSHECFEFLSQHASLLMGKIYVDYFFDPKEKTGAEDIFNEVKSQTRSYLSQVSWLDEQMKEGLSWKLGTMNSIIGYGEGVMSPVTNFFEDVDLEREDAFSIFLRVSNTLRRYKWNQSSMSREEHRMVVSLQHALEPKIYYEEATRTIYVNAGLLREPYFSLNRPSYLNYGALGVAMTRSIVRSLDIFAVCDRAINCPNHEFAKKRRCLEELFSGYLVDTAKEHVDGERTVEANFEDLIAFRIAYRAYQNLAASRGVRESTIPGFKYNITEWFWISLAATSCEYQEAKYLHRFIIANKRSPAEAVLNVGASSLIEFSDDFQCAMSSRVANLDKCLI